MNSSELKPVRSIAFLLLIFSGVAVYTVSSLFDILNIKNLLQINLFSSSNPFQSTDLFRSFALLFAGSSFFRLLGTIITEYGCSLYGSTIASQKFFSVFSIHNTKDFNFSQSEISSFFSTEVHALINGLLLPVTLFIVSVLNIIIIVIGSAAITDPSFLVAPILVFFLYLAFFIINTKKSRSLRSCIKHEKIRVHKIIKEMYVGRFEYVQSYRYDSHVKSYASSIKKLSSYDIQVKVLGIYPKHFLEITAATAFILASSFSLLDQLYTSGFSMILAYGYLIQRLIPLAQTSFSQISAIRCFSYVAGLFDLNLNSSLLNFYASKAISRNSDNIKQTFVDEFAFTISSPKSLKSSQTPFLLSKPIRFQSGNIYCISGPSGIGKSLFCRSIAGFVDQSFDLSIDILSNNKDHHVQVRNLQSQEYLSYLYIPQNSFLLDDSIWSNVTLFDNGFHECLSTDDVKSILDIGSNGVLESRADLDLHTSCNINNQKLSGGQLQRIVLAKSLFSSRHILILDEPSSQLDTMAELDFINLVKNMISTNKVVILVSHSQQIQKLADYHIDLADYVVR